MTCTQLRSAMRAYNEQDRRVDASDPIELQICRHMDDGAHSRMRLKACEKKRALAIARHACAAVRIVDELLFDKRSTAAEFECCVVLPYVTAVPSLKEPTFGFPVSIGTTTHGSAESDAFEDVREVTLDALLSVKCGLGWSGDVVEQLTEDDDDDPPTEAYVSSANARRAAIADKVDVLARHISSSILDAIAASLRTPSRRKWDHTPLVMYL